MDTTSIGLIVFFGLFCLGSASNKYNDHGIVLTARPYTGSGGDHRQLVTIPVVPSEIPNYQSRTFPGLKFDDIKMKLHACDVDYDMNMVYIYDYNYRQMLVGSNFNTSVMKEGMNFTKERYGVSQEYVKLAVDWISHNVYWTDTVMGAIMMQPGRQGIDQTLFMRVIYKGLDLPRGIAVDPISGILAWTDFSKNPKIERSSLTGEDRKILVHSGLYLPDAITADHDSQLLYFTDLNFIKSVSYDGIKTRTLLANDDAYFFDIAIFKDVVMATDIDSPYFLYFYNTTTGERVAKEDSSDEAFFGVCMYHKDIQPSAAQDRCSVAGCGDICVDEPGKAEATCLCRMGYALNNTDGKTCYEKEGQYYRAIILNNGTHLCKLDIHILSDHHNHKVDCFYQHTEPTETMTFIEVNMRSREVYFSTEKAIYRVPIDKSNAAAVELTETLPNNQGNGRVTGMSYDYVSSHLYWTESDPDGVFVMNPDSPASEFLQLVSAQDNVTTNPRAILVVPHERKLLWLSGQHSSVEDVIIQHTDLGASAPVAAIIPTDLPTSIYLNEPTHMYNNVKEQRLYILDQGWEEVLIYTYNGSYITDYNTYDTKDFALYQDSILILEHDSNNNTVLKSADLGYGPPLHYVADGIVQDIGTVISMKILDANVLQPTYANPCRDLNGNAGGCDQFCFAIGEQTVCRCDTGFTLNSDNKTCDSETVQDNFIIVTDDTNSKVLQMDLTKPEIIHGIKAPEQTSLTGVFYNYITGKIILGSYTSDQIWSFNIDGSNATMVADISLLTGTPNKFALDPTTGNLYITGIHYWASYFDWSFIAVISPSGLVTIVIDDVGGNLADIVLHAGKGYMFWADVNSDGLAFVYRASMDGSNQQTIASGDGLTSPVGLAIDYEENLLYWTDKVTNKIHRCDFDGNDRNVFLEESGPLADIRLVGDYLYYIATENIYITRVHKHNTSDIMKFGPSSGVGVFESLDVYISAEMSKIPKNSACLNNNGDCSHFCFPKEDGGRTCGCEKIYDLLVDDKTCENLGCPASVTNALIDSTCLRLPGNQCDFTCYADLRPKNKNKKLTCLSDLTWDDDTPCKESKYKNKYGDHGIVLTARGFNLDDFRQIVAIPTTPKDISNYPGRTFPGTRFPDIKKKLHACDTDYNMNMLYLYDYEYRTIMVGNNFNSSVMKEAMNFTTEHNSVSQEYVKLAVDWVSHNIYWTDSVMDAIMMQPGGQYIDPTLYRIVVQLDLDLPRGLAVDPLSGYIFWSDFTRNGNGKLERASLTGGDRTPLITNALYLPDAITADHASGRIYFTNYYAIESARYDGLERIQLVKKSQAYFFDISIFQDVLMVTDISKYYLFFYDSKNGEEAVPREGSSKEGYYGICSYHSSVQPPSALDECDEARCQDICVKEPNTIEATCLCRIGFELNNDGKTCREAAGQYHRAIILNNGTHLCFLNVQILSDHHDHKVDCFYQHSEASELIQYIDVNMKTREVFFSTNKTIYRVPIDNRNANAVKLATAPGGRNKGEITGLSYDWINNHLYWSETGPDGVFLINPDDPEEFLQVVGHEDTFIPRAVLVVPHNRTVFWLATNSTGNTSHIEYGDLGVTRPVSKVMGADLSLLRPTHIYHDVKYQQLYVLDVEWSSVLQCSYNGTFRDYYDSGDAKDFALYKDYLLLMKHDKDGNTILYSADVGYAGPVLAGVADGKVEDIGTVISIKIIDVDTLQPSYPSPCGEKEGKYGGCEQICIPVGEQAKCMCDSGFTLNSDNITCDSTLVQDDFIIVTDALHSKVFQISLDKVDEIQGIKMPNKEAPSGLLYNYLTNQIVWGSGESSQIWGVNIDGSNATFISDIDTLYGYPVAFALDPTSGNIYMAAISYYADYFHDSFIAVINPSGGSMIVYDMGHLIGDIVIHPEKGYMFWTDYGASDMVVRAGMDGSDIKILAESPDTLFPIGLAIDYDEDLIYWTDALSHKIFRCDFNGNDIVAFHGDTGYMVDIRLYGDYLYYTGMDNMHITKIHKHDTTNITTIGPKSGVGNFETLDIYSSAAAPDITVNDVCSKNNDGCSHLCLPNGKGAATCGCEGVFQLLPDLKTCENVPRCLATIKDGMITDDCHRLPGQVCDFKCNSNFRPQTGVLQLTCQGPSDEELNWGIESPCEEILCPAIIPKGQLPENCSSQVGASCGNFTCIPGYERNEAVTGLTCTGNGTWSTPPSMLCKEKCPPFSLDREMATLASSCKRDPQEMCGYTCKPNYKPTSSQVSTIQCMSGSRWGVTTNNLCEEILCPDYIPDGRIHRDCTFKVDAGCTFDCDDRFTHSTRVYQIKCLPSGNWSQANDLTSLCIATPPPVPAKQNDNVVIGLGVGMGILVLIIIVIIVVIMLYRMGKLPGKSGTSGSSFENPRYAESSFDAPPAASAGEANKDFSYTTLDEDKLELTDESWRKAQARAPDNVYDNSPATIPSSTINPKF